MNKFLKFLIPIVILFFLILNILRDWHGIISQLRNFNPIFLVISFIIMLLIYPEAAICWHIILNKMGVKNNIIDSSRVWILSTASRYIPGSIWQYLGRVELAKKILGLNRDVTVITLLFEIFLAIIAATLMSVYTITVLPQFQGFLNFWYMLLFIPLILIHPIFSEKIIKILARAMNRELNSNINKLSLIKTLSILPYYLLNFLLNGLALFFLILSTVNSGNIPSILQLSSAYSLSWLIGFVTIFAPAGLGVTEISLTYFLSLYHPLSLASFIAITYRVMLILAEIIVFFVALSLGNKNER